MALIMQRLLRRVVPVLFATVAVVYLGDWLILSLRPAPQPPASIQVDQFLKTPLKGQKEEYDYMGTVVQPCVSSLFPHRAQTPCWWLVRHKTQWISP